MKFSYNWLKELAPGLDADAREVGRQITMKTAECEGVEAHGSDWVIEIDNKSLTHRPDLWGHIGMAREVAAHFDLLLRDPTNLSLLPVGDPAVTVRIDNLDLCPRFSAVMYEGVQVGPSPVWLQQRLEAIGINPINNLVDITNWVMAELPQPMHAFDADKVPSHTLIARAAKPGETCKALNGETYELDPSVIAVAGVDGALAIAGVMGGESSMIGDSTTRVIFEAANWHPASVRKASTKLKLRTDASMRFEKALDPENTARGLARAVELMRLCCPAARLVGGLADIYRPLIPPDPIELPMEWLSAKLGKRVEAADVSAILRSIGFGVEDAPGMLLVTVPSWRATKDISIKDDLVEEVGRMIGYGSITPAAPLMAVTPARPNTVRKFQNFIRGRITDLGFDEVQNYSFVSDAEAARFGLPAGDHLRVRNPISEDQALLRVSLIPKIHRNVEENRKHFESFRLFEIGHEIHRREGDLPDEIPHLAAAVYAKDDGLAGLTELKRAAAALMPGAEFRPASAARVFEHPARIADIFWRRELLGRLFEFHPGFVEQGRAAVLDVDLRKLQALSESRETKYSPVGRFPSSTFDLAIVVAPQALAGDVARDVPEAEFREDFRLPDGRRSLLFRFTLSAPDRTLTGEEIAAARQKWIETLRSKGYELRA
jgi:phenylalanyl-tRNA synthetase beta chain